MDAPVQKVLDQPSQLARRILSHEGTCVLDHPQLGGWKQAGQALPVRDQVATALEKRSGLTALAGTGDMREVEAAASRGDADAVLAIDVYTHRLVAGIAAMSAAIGGLDVLAFTGGVGEHSPIVRHRAAEKLDFLGVAIDTHTNEATRDDGEISAAEATARTVVIVAREDLQIAHEVRELLRN